MKKPQLALAILAYTVPHALAQAGDVDARVNAALDKVLAEWTVYVSCSALDQDTQASLGGMWQQSAAKTGEALKAKGADAVLVQSVMDRMAGLKPAVTLSTPASELIGYCRAQGDWQGRLNRLDITRPEEALNAAFAGGQ